MLYYLFQYLDTHYSLPGTGVFQYISFRAAMAVLTSLVISLLFGNTLVGMLRRKQVGETVRDLGLDGQIQKQGTPTMGGLIILGAILVPVLLFARLDNIYVIIMIITTVFLGAIGFIDDYIKVFKKNKKGLAGKFKVVGQVAVGVVVGSLLYFNEAVVSKEKVAVPQSENVVREAGEAPQQTFEWVEEKSVVTTIPFIKNNEFNYAWLLGFMSKENAARWAWLVFIPIVVFVVTAVSNGANITDGLDGLATGSSAIIGVVLAIFAFVSGNLVFADYLNIMFIPNSGELTVFISAFVGACIGFLWYNSYPAQVFMGDTGSLALGGIIAVFALAIRKELLIPLFCGVFLIENISVMIQVAYFKYSKKRFGEGRRVFLMAPLHHHYQKLGYHESKIVSRFWIVGILLAVLSIVTLKLR
ncbi:phospho-N-acetylmuramoyl-pentapeptide-transferase [Cryomorpha ignava]|uniref:Phospho-N-acetylmuramoyl-pentapeptide-transferase n=1 Tax=Cryomorpha ignava TaxID=101383 RepID=A0A7K3WNA8_9FLAO|nr:phospho-N-acetylmuramoyl-pentapeptide-transferase [Cryomorpha ignava]NEN22974.1 phospho-N-acetylmuramoyl-pentapeptide-transferase [Cryomorpha ignava]